MGWELLGNGTASNCLAGKIFRGKKFMGFSCFFFFPGVKDDQRVRWCSHMKPNTSKYIFRYISILFVNVKMIRGFLTMRSRQIEFLDVLLRGFGPNPWALVFWSPPLTEFAAGSTVTNMSGTTYQLESGLFASRNWWFCSTCNTWHSRCTNGYWWIL